MEFKKNSYFKDWDNALFMRFLYESYPPHGKKIEETPREYANNLMFFISKYKEAEIDSCISNGHYLEAIGTLHIQISEQLRLLMIKRIKGLESIPIDYNDRRFKKVIKTIKWMKDSELYDFAFIFKRIDEIQYNKLKQLNALRNDFSHSFKERKKYSEKQIKTIINKSKGVEKHLANLVREANVSGEIIF